VVIGRRLVVVNLRPDHRAAFSSAFFVIVWPLPGVLRRVRARYPFAAEAAVILPDHLHALRTLPEDDADFTLR
jgi:putative transposase